MCDLTIAKEIQRQLFATGKIKVFSWGSNCWKGGENYLQFKVQGFKFIGTVRITLNGRDMYDIEFKNENAVVVKIINDVFWDCLVTEIDEVVETTNGKYSS